MGVVLSYIRVSPANAALLLQHPKLMHALLGFEESAASSKRSGFLSRLFGRKVEPKSKSESLPSLEPREGEDEGDTDKAWQGMHFILTGTAEGGDFPEGFIMHGGTPAGDDREETGARLFQPEEVQRIQAVLEAQTEDGVRLRYDGKKMDTAGVYPQIWQRDGEEGVAYIWETLCEMREFVRETVEKKWALLVFFS
ncbi:uncharacterized protein DUF1877 [Roseimicrobium gellanilyticum]|uniref:Uncharacterized protein DUF1877 n=1 Tax=Roseimicrobium gellanilyticum TaxID=748857 RepID=A0A366HDP0_9BACT|nr:YfbM family protein [Roseimicrobium gellanilyticum]RBP39845.1 uncharacterized protein DUF1877 [Roseimicrobium gellanilyticum]